MPAHEAVRPNDEEEHHSFGDLLALDRNVEQDQQVVQHAENEHADDGPERAAAAAEQACAPEHRGDDRVEILARSSRRNGAARAGRDHHSSERGCEAAEHEADELRQTHAYAGKPSDHCVEPHDVKAAPEHRARHDELELMRNGDKKQHRVMDRRRKSCPGRFH